MHPENRPPEVSQRKPVLDECAIDDELGLVGADLARLPLVDLLLQRLEIPLHLIDAN